MNETIFGLGSVLALLGWLLLLLSPLMPRVSDAIAGIAIPLLLSLAYTALVLAHWSGAEGGFDSLEAVMTLFTQPAVALAGWLHYLAFDLFIGAWIVRTARADGIAFVLVVPCLVSTLLFGPAGLLLFQIFRTARLGGRPTIHEASREPPQPPVADPRASE